MEGGYRTCGRGKYKESEIKERLVALSVRSDNDHIASAKGVTLELVVEDLGALCRSLIPKSLDTSKPSFSDGAPSFSC